MNAEKSKRLEQLRRAVALQHLQRNEGPVPRSSLSPPIMPADRSAPLPLSWAQQRLWFLSQLDHAAGAAYHMPAALRLSGQLDVPALRSTLDRVVARHENLRTTFVEVGGAPVQKIAPADSGFTLTEHDLSALGPAEREEKTAQLGASEARAHFDLATGPLIRGRLLHLSEDEHMLLVTQHHIVSDGWSTGVLIREVVALYTAFSNGQPDPLPPLTIQYADYAAWQRQRLDAAALQSQMDFWCGRLAGAPTLLELPTDRQRPPAQSYSGGRFNFMVPAGLTKSLREFSRAHGATLFMTMLAGWSALLSRLSGQHDVVVGTSVANRPRSEVEQLIGFFLNSLALRVSLAPHLTVADLMAQVRTTTLDAYEHQDVPFEQVVEALQPERTLSYSPVFQTMLSFNNTPGGVLELPNLSFESVSTARQSAHFDIELSINETGDVLRAGFAYATDLFDPPTVERFASYFLSLLSAMVEDASQPIGHLPLMTAKQRDEVLNCFNDTGVDYASQCPAHVLFERQARLKPSATALIHAGVVTTYAQLNQRANQVAHWLITTGVKPDDRVAICARRGPAMIIAVLGVLKAGGAYVPLDPTYPTDRLAHVLQDSAPAAVLLQSDSGRNLPPAAVPTLSLEDPTLGSRPGHDPQVPLLSPEHLAYVLYTSGSTGRPKGAMVHHRGLSNYLHQGASQYLREDLKGGIVSTPFGFDATVTTMMVPWLAGKPVVLLPEDDHGGLEALLGYVRESQPWLFKLTPAHLDALADLSTSPSPTHHVIVVGGEQLTRRSLARFRERVLPNAGIVNEYGPTEAVVGCTTYFSDGQDPHRTGGAVPIGRPIANMRVYLLDERMQPVPVGVPGEMYIGGVQIARGYLNLPDLTRERFVDDPFGGDGERLYRTGDLARRLPCGNIEYLRRNDFQVKLRGFRIELGEIEEKLVACPGVREAVVLAREDVPGDKRLVAYLVSDPGAGLEMGTVRALLERELPGYMMPSAFVRLDALPRTPNGKLDRAALPSPDASAVDSRPYEAPVGATEEIVAEVWQELLGLQVVSRHDNFFKLGGHSLLAIRLIECLRRRGLTADVGMVFTAPTLIKLAEQLVHAPGTAPDFEVPANRIADVRQEPAFETDIEEYRV